jgi:phospholipase/carboxylesterase
MDPYHEKEIGGLPVIERPGDPDLGTIVLLHGFGADADDLAFLGDIYKGPRWLFPKGPLEIPFGPGNVGRAWFPVNIEFLIHAMKTGQFSEISKAFPSPHEFKEASNLLDHFLAQLNVPRSTVFLGGFSQGAILSVETALQSEEKYGGLLIFSGTFIENLGWSARAPRHAGTPFFISHGTHDSILPFQKAEVLETLLLESGWKGRLHRFHGGHEIPPSALLEVALFLKLNMA